MAPPRTYPTAGAFRKALEERLKRTSQTDQIDLNRLRRHVSFDRLLARLFRVESPPWVLKGGYASAVQVSTWFFERVTCGITSRDLSERGSRLSENSCDSGQNRG